MTHFGSISRVGRVYTPSVRPVPVRTLYVRPGGNDSAAGTVGAPLASLEGALSRVPSIIDDARYVIDVTDYSRLTSEPFHFQPKVSGLPVDLEFTGQFLQDFNRAPITIVATPDVYATLTITSQSGDAVTQLRTINTSNNFTLNELQGKTIRGANLGEVGVVAGNTAGPNSSVYVAFYAAMTAPVQVLELTSSFAFGDLTDLYNRTSNCAMPCPIAFTGINLLNDNSTSDVALWVKGAFFYEMCRIQGLYQEEGLSRFDACFFDGGLLSANGHQNTIYQSYMKNVNIQYHGEGGAGGQGYYWTVVEGCTPLGRHNNFQSPGGFDVAECDIVSPKVNGSAVGAATNGVLMRSGTTCRVRNTRINGATTAILCESPGRILLDNVQGTTNTDYGVWLQNGAQMQRANAAAVTGDDGDILLGDIAADWVDGPTGNADHYVRWF